MSVKQSPISVLGAGAWGTALALLLVRNGNSVRLWSHDPAQVKLMREQRANPEFLPDFSLPEALQLEDDLAVTLQNVQDILIAVPSQAFTQVLFKIKACGAQPRRVVWGTKGLDAGSGRLLHEMVAEVLGVTVPAAVISGPSFAHELAAGLPTAVSLSGNQPDFLRDLVLRFHGDNLRVYENPDFIGVQLCGVVKNILAIAVGMADGLQLGANTRCALITRGMAEMARLNAALGGKSSTLMSLAGVGDLVLTCTDNQSRNRRFGLAVGAGASPQQAALQIGKAIEGLANTELVRNIARRFLIDMPITDEIHKILYHGHSPAEVVTSLLKREPKSE
jgi:glycerol-3-phosphate dehydrogenase (NAD(P)+)